MYLSGYFFQRLSGLWVLLGVFCCLSAVSARDLHAQYILQVNVTRMNPHLGQLFEIRVVDVASGIEVARARQEKIVEQDFYINFSGILQAGHTYNLDAYADYSGNGEYDAPPADHAWRVTISNVTGNTVATVEHTINWTDIKFPNQGDGNGEPVVTCSCDLTGDGLANVMDVLEWLRLKRTGSDTQCLDYNLDGRVAISDLVRLLIEIRAGGCI